jgi:hypothetical protein
MNGAPIYFVLTGLAALTLCSCSKKQDFGKETFPVKGQVYVDGQPAARLSVSLNNVNGVDLSAAYPALPTAITKEDGTFEISTFVGGDGAPAGEYTATFLWGKPEGLSIDTDIDKLKGRYADPKRSQIKLTVTEGQPTDMGRIDLKTK